MSYLEELLPEFRKGAKIRCKSWKAGEYIYIDKKGSVMTEKGNVYILDYVDFDSEYWELYQEPIDWQYIIDHRCLCWFWDDKFNWAMCGTLGKIEKWTEYGFTMFDDAGNRNPYKHCRPVRRDEVTFYEEKEEDD